MKLRCAEQPRPSLTLITPSTMHSDHALLRLVSLNIRLASHRLRNFVSILPMLSPNLCLSGFPTAPTYLYLLMDLPRSVLCR